MWKLLQQIVSIIVQLNSNKREFQKQPLTKVSQNRCSHFAKFKWKHLRWSLFSISYRPKTCNSIKKRLQHMCCFPVNFAKFLRTLLYRTLPDDCFWIFSFILLLLPPYEPIKTSFFYQFFLSVFENVLSWAWWVSWI